jgi:hypothetical protein
MPSDEQKSSLKPERRLPMAVATVTPMRMNC